MKHLSVCALEVHLWSYRYHKIVYPGLNVSLACAWLPSNMTFRIGVWEVPRELPSRNVAKPLSDTSELCVHCNRGFSALNINSCNFILYNKHSPAAFSNTFTYQSHLASFEQVYSSTLESHGLRQGAAIRRRLCGLWWPAVRIWRSAERLRPDHERWRLWRWQHGIRWRHRPWLPQKLPAEGRGNQFPHIISALRCKFSLSTYLSIEVTVTYICSKKVTLVDKPFRVLRIWPIT